MLLFLLGKTAFVSSAVRFRYEIVKTYYNTENLSSQQEKAEFLD
ncbi:hypothetical protein PMCN01_1027 [Pasteurella multocida subsp. multocida HB01]|nr:hypothetical protein Pmu_11080 [Pasteurella multocida 36950]AFF24337.1 hypothetical protein PMCN06_1095 [Pasteurella multocida subsp. multocida str. HN06]AFI46247.1 hypothetical protein NT08PM_1127 [Pasteurella multocida subsp. multocida str. 3480]AHE64493.1 hypothetical protein PMCN03_1038 [Pasteurella multocida subsp. multocida str. HB03]ANJ90255.1 hypothetical protein PMCN01_1027 [Pasteurella multocida subsp. multocida HB01]APW55619.1 hypothetical protein PMCN07_1035 [Pasteurella multoci